MGQRMRNILHEDKLIIRPCAYDCISAKMIIKAGFDVCGTSGYAISASMIGQPDIGLLSWGEMFETVKRIRSICNIPIDVDADTGYGDEKNVYWTVRNLQQIDIGSVRIEDQTWPKRCGHMSGKKIISASDMIKKIKAAVQARHDLGYNDSDGIVIGIRTDANGLECYEKVIERCNKYVDAGAEYVYVECPESLAEVEKLVSDIKSPLAFNTIPGGKKQFKFTLAELESAGVKLLSVPMVCLYTATSAMIDNLNSLKKDRLDLIESDSVKWKDFNEMMSGEIGEFLKNGNS